MTQFYCFFFLVEFLINKIFIILPIIFSNKKLATFKEIYLLLKEHKNKIYSKQCLKKLKTIF